MNHSIRRLQGEALLDALYVLDSYSLHPSPPFQNKEDWYKVVRERKGVTCYARFDEERPVSIAVSTAMTQNIREKLFPACGVWGVATHPSARRKGYCKETMASLLTAERESGKVFSNLYPFRESFYERLGYIAFPLTKIAKLTPFSLESLLKMDFDGEVELLLIGEAYDAYREYLTHMRVDRHGMAFFDFGDRASANRNTLWAALARFDQKIEGIMLYRLDGEEVAKFRFNAYRFYYQTSKARYLMLNWIARHIDQADRVEIWLPEDEYPETWIADLNVKIETAIRPAMCRVLDVGMLSGMRVGEGHFSARIHDPLCDWNEGIWCFKSEDGKLIVTKGSEVDCDLTIQGLSALVAGVRDPQDYEMRRWGNPDNGIQTIIRTMFPKMRPFLHENF